MISITTTAFESGGTIPARFTCDGREERPQFVISGTNEKAKSFALIVDDPDAPGGDFVHWVLFNIPANTETIGEILPTGSVEGTSSAGNIGWVAPCPPSGEHHYHFKLYVLDTILDLEADAKKSDLLSKTQGHTISKAEIVGLYTRNIK